MIDLNLVVCIDKPIDWTSFDVVAKIRGILRAKTGEKKIKVGHSGTLDPIATGVLPVFIGKATKQIPLIENHDKAYIAGFKLGISSNTQDITGEIKEVSDRIVFQEELSELLPKFTGEIEQIPPMFSAIKVNGQRLYDLARQGKEVERKSRKVNIFNLNLLSFDKNCGVLEIKCSKGTYIRTLINDLGEVLGCGAVMTSLVRTEACGFTLKDCISIGDFERDCNNRCF
ncbi:MAG: tRNA pseudouridine(55) synthase TruB [Oscillospiraceae bacterium]|nr:tRNA pseudouridine(55) synthase TruB [Oscillospiraceae bacterium]